MAGHQDGDAPGSQQVTAGHNAYVAGRDLYMDMAPPAGRPEIVAYLNALVKWLTVDQWPLDQRFSGAALTAPVIEQKLRVAPAAVTAADDAFDADELVFRCRRLVILGGPGSGKTWLARRTARRSAEQALQDISDGAALDEVELPLYTTCPALVRSAGVGVREAAVLSALDQLADLGPAHSAAAIRAFFMKRADGIFLIVDSLDEAQGAAERLRQADDLPWRILLTSRHNSWNSQLVISSLNPADAVAELQPLAYPADVEVFIGRWFHGSQERTDALCDRIAADPGLQEAARVPLILTFYCMLGGRERLPAFRHQLHSTVINGLLTGRWRGVEDRDPDVEHCLGILREWAREAALNDDISGIGVWSDEISPGHVRMGQEEKAALNDVAPRQPLPQLDDRVTVAARRFVHRSLHEHLVAAHVAGLDVNEAAEALLPHLWHDPDWEDVVPAAIAMHRERDQLLRTLLCLAARSDEVPQDLSIISAGPELRRVLARVAAESSQDAWSEDMAEIISQSRLELAAAGRVADVVQARWWPESNREIRGSLLGRLDGAGDTETAVGVALGLAQQAPTAYEASRACHVLSNLLLQEASREGGDMFAWHCQALVTVILKFARSDASRQEVQGRILGILAQRVADDGSWVPAVLVDGIVRLATTADARQEACRAILDMLGSDTGARVSQPLVEGVVSLSAGEQHEGETRRGLIRTMSRTGESWKAMALADGISQLTLTGTEKAQVIQCLLQLLESMDSGTLMAAKHMIDRLDQYAEDLDERGRCIDSLLRLLGHISEFNVALAAGSIVDGILQLGITEESKSQAREIIIEYVASRWNAQDYVSLGVTAGAADALIRLGPGEDEKRRAAKGLIRLLRKVQVTAHIAFAGHNSDAEDLTRVIALLDPCEDDRCRARRILLHLLGSDRVAADPASDIAAALSLLGPSEEEKRQALEEILRLTETESDPYFAERLSRVAADLSPGDHEAALRLDPTETGKRQARDTAVQMIDSMQSAQASPNTDRSERKASQQEYSGEIPPSGPDVDLHYNVLYWTRAFAGTPQADLRKAQVSAQIARAADAHHARQILLQEISSTGDPWLAVDLLRWLAQLNPMPPEKYQARRAILRLVNEGDNFTATRVAGEMILFDPTVDERREVRDGLLGRLSAATDPEEISDLELVLTKIAATSEYESLILIRDQILLKLETAQNAKTACTIMARLIFGLSNPEKKRAREALVRLLNQDDDIEWTGPLMRWLIRLDPTIHDLSTWGRWAAEPPSRLIAEARRNTNISAWLESLPTLRNISMKAARMPSNPESATSHAWQVQGFLLPSGNARGGAN